MAKFYLANPTTFDHFVKYEQLRRKLNVSLLESKSFSPQVFNDRTVEEWTIAFKFDRNLNGNNIKPTDFDWAWHYHAGKVSGYSLAENCCLYKHCIIYQMVGAVPVFDDGSFNTMYCLDNGSRVPVTWESAYLSKILASVNYDWAPKEIHPIKLERLMDTIAREGLE